MLLSYPKATRVTELKIPRCIRTSELSCLLKSFSVSFHNGQQKDVFVEVEQYTKVKRISSNCSYAKVLLLTSFSKFEKFCDSFFLNLELEVKSLRDLKIE